MGATAARRVLNGSPTMQSTETGQILTPSRASSPLQLSTRLALVGVAVTALGAAIWTLTTAPLSHAPAATNARLTGVVAVDSARKYVLARPLDAAGWLGWVGASGMISQRPLPANAEAMIDVAARLAPLDPQVLRARALALAARGNNRGALDLLDQLAQAGGEESDAALAAMIPLVGSPEFQAFTVDSLRNRNPVVDALLLKACQGNVEFARLAPFAQTVVRVRPIPDRVLRCIGERAIASNLVPFAHWLWLNGASTLPKSIGFVVNGDFDSVADVPLFGWKISPGGEYRDGFNARIRPAETPSERGNVLAIRLNGRSLRPPVAQQVLALPVGAYRLEYRVNNQSSRAADQMTWQVVCLERNLTLTSAERRVLPGDSGWSTHSSDLVVPPECTGQLLTLDVGSRLSAADGARGTITFDDIRITRLGNE